MIQEIEKSKTFCTSCKQELGEKGVIFDCLKCGKKKIARCLKCKKISSQYTCEQCGFTGP